MNLCDVNGMTALHFAAEEGDHAICSSILSNCADPYILNDYYHLPVHLASRNGFPSVVNLLLSNGPAGSLTHTSGEAPLCQASRYGAAAVDTRTVPLPMKVEVHKCTGRSKCTMCALASAAVGDVEAVKRLFLSVPPSTFKHWFSEA